LSLVSDFSFSLALELLSRLADGGALPPALLAGFKKLLNRNKFQENLDYIVKHFF